MDGADNLLITDAANQRIRGGRLTSTAHRLAWSAVALGPSCGDRLGHGHRDLHRRWTSGAAWTASTARLMLSGPGHPERECGSLA